MNTAKERKTIEAALANYRQQLDTIPDGDFNTTPPGGGWSYSEVYAHILKATLGSTIALERCANGSTKASKNGPTFLGRLMMFTGSFPPVKVKVPEAIESKMPVDKISKEEARNLIVKCLKRVETVIPLVKNSPKDTRSKHPRLGMLNARQWLKFIRIHALHHLKQLQRIQKKLSTA